MKNMIKVLWYIIMSAMVLAMFVLVSAKVLAHGNGQCITDVDGDVFLGDGSYVKIVRHLSVDELKAKDDDKLDHGHKNQYYDKHGNETTLSTSFYGKDGGLDKDEFYVDCPTLPPTPAPPPRRSPTPTTTAVPTGVPSILYGRSAYTEPIEVEPECAEESSQHFLWHGETLFGLRLLPQGVETMSDLWNAYGFSVEKGNKIWLNFIGWVQYDAGEYWGLAKLPISANMGFVIDQTKGNLLFIEGCPLQNDERIWLFPGLNIVGFPEPPDLFELPSDFLSDTILSVKVQVGTPYGAFYHTIEAPGDEADTPIQAGQAVILNSTEHQWLNLSTPISAAPQAQRRDTLATSWGSLKRIP